MYVGGTDVKALHHLFAEVLDNSMDEAVAGHATFIEVTLDEQGYITVTDNGRGIPVDEHPQYPGQSALEIIMTKLHSGGKFNGDAYEASGGLHGVGVSVVNALSDDLTVEVARGKMLYRQSFSRGVVLGPVEKVGAVQNRRGTSVRFHQTVREVENRLVRGRIAASDERGVALPADFHSGIEIGLGALGPAFRI
jgi:topoisomerase-4 subunit B